MTLFLVIPLGSALAGGEVSVLVTRSSGDYGTGVDNDTDWLTFRYVTGRRLQFRADLSMIRSDVSDSTVSYTALGPMSQGRNGSGSMQGPGGSSSQTAATGAASTQSGLGDVRLAMSRAMFGGGAKLFRVDAGLEVKIPTADEENQLGTGAWDYRVGFAGEYRFWSSSVFGGLGWNALGDTSTIEFDNVLDGYAGLDSNPFAGDRLIATGWLEGWQPAIDGVDSRAALGLGIRNTGRLRWRLQARVGLTDAAEDLALVAGLSYGIASRGPGVRGTQR